MGNESEKEEMVEEVKEDVEDMLEDYQPLDREPKEEPEETPEEKPEEPSEEKPEETPETPETPEEGEPAQEPETPAEEAEDWVPPSKEQYENLLLTVNELAGKVGLALPTDMTPKETPVEEPKETPKGTPPTAPELKIDIPGMEAISLVADEDELYELTRDPRKFNDAINKALLDVYNKAAKVATESALRSVPQIVSRSVETASVIQKAADDFYRDNEDLRPFKKFVAFVTTDIVSKNPDKDLVELLPEIASTTREKLNLKKIAEKKEEEGNDPAFVKKKTTRRKPAEKPTGLQAEIDELL